MDESKTVNEIKSTAVKPRYDWLDAIKAFAMLLVIFGHLGLSSVPIYQAYASFIKLPLFFAASGFVFNPEKSSHLKQFIFLRFKRIMIPYFALSVILQLIKWLSNGFALEQFYSEYIRPIVTAEVMWFLPALFICNVAMAVVFRLAKNRNLVILLTAIIALIIGGIPIFEDHFFMSINACFVSYAFCLLGYYLKKYVMHANKKILLIVSAVLLLVYLVLPFVYCNRMGAFNYINLYSSFYSCYPLDMCISLAGTIGVFLVAPFFKYPKGIVWFGKNTLFYYAFHQVMCEFVLFFIQKFIWAGCTIDYLYTSFQTIMLYCAITVLTLLLLVPICMLVNKYLPELVGLKRKKRIA